MEMESIVMDMNDGWKNGLYVSVKCLNNTLKHTRFTNAKNNKILTAIENAAPSQKSFNQ